MNVTIILPTRNRAAMLEGALVSLCEQSYDCSRYQIFVVDNGSTDNTANLVKTIAARYPQLLIRHILAPVAGLSRARNAGLDECHTDFVAFTEDDAIMPPEWLENLLQIFAAHDDSLVKVGGEITPIWDVAPPHWLSQDMAIALSATSGKTNGAGFCDPPLLESNSCYRRAALQKIGGFPVNLGRQDNSLLSGEQVVDIHLHILGGKIYYASSVIMYHKIPAQRLTPQWLRRRYFWQGASHYLVEKYLEKFGYSLGKTIDLHLPLNYNDWLHIHDADLPPDDDHLGRVRSLGFALAASGLLGLA